MFMLLDASVTARPSAPATHPLFGAFAVFLGLALTFGYLNFLREPPSGDFHAEWMALVFFCVAAAALAPLLPQRFSVSWSMLIGPAALCAVMAVQAALGRYGYVQDLLLWPGYMVLAVLAMVLGQGIRAAGLTGEVASRIAWALVVTATLNALAQVAQALRMEQAFAPFVVPIVERSICRLYGNIAQANQATTLAWLGIGSVLYLNGVGRLSSRWAMPFLIVLLIGSALSASRMGWLFMALVIAVVVGLRAWPARGRASRWLIAAMLVGGFAAASVGATTMLGFVDARCSSGLERLANAQEAGSVIRMELWRQAIDVWRTSPWIGVGAMKFAPVVFSIDPLDVHRPLDMYAHNTALQLLAEFGLVGAGAFALSVFAWICQVFSRRRQLEAADGLMLVILGVLGIHAMLEFPLHYTYFLLLAGLAAGLLVRPEALWPAPAARLRLPIAGLAAALLTGAAATFADYTRLDRLFWLEDQRLGYGAMPTPEVRKLLTDASVGIWIFEPFRDHLLGLSDPITKEDLPRKIADTERILAYSPQSVIMARRIALAVLDDDPERAHWLLQRMFGFFPHQAEEMHGQLMRFIRDRPDEFAVLEPILDDEFARRPRPRW